MDTGAVYYAKQDHAYVLKFVGAIRYTLGCALDDFLNHLFRQRDFDNILIDLRETTSIDSTSLGLLAKIANFMSAQLGKRTTIVSTNADINQTLDSVGFYQVFSICQDPEAQCPQAERLVPDQDVEPDRQHLGETLYEAHRLLSELNEKNRATFHNVLEALKPGKS
ncbi:MAG TPA: STAS domain-containing protein [Candidatus Competibacteraceae bacterium]|nr:STAS domain-containing protein [Candidatus Competibacteraceae bacterium]